MGLKDHVVHEQIKRWFASVTESNGVSKERGAAVDQELSWGEGKLQTDHGLVLTRSGCFGLHTRLGSDFFPTDNCSDNDCW